MSTPSFEARIVRGAGMRDSELEIRYDGTAPPLALLEDLRTIGWVPPVPSPPPATAIDWSCPDPRTGARYTLRPYAAVGHAVPGPDAQDLAVLERVVARHRGAEPVEPAEPADAPGAVVPADAPTAAASGMTDSHISLPTPQAVPPPHPEREVQIGATVDETRATEIRDALTRRGWAVRSTRMSLTTPGGYRGNTIGAQESAVRLQLRAPISQIDEVVAILGADASDVVVRR
jgi:hypothetical protein